MPYQRGESRGSQLFSGVRSGNYETYENSSKSVVQCRQSNGTIWRCHRSHSGLSVSEWSFIQKLPLKIEARIGARLSICKHCHCEHVAMGRYQEVWLYPFNSESPIGRLLEMIVILSNTTRSKNRRNFAEFIIVKSDPELDFLLWSWSSRYLPVSVTADDLNIMPQRLLQIGQTPTG